MYLEYDFSAEDVSVLEKVISVLTELKFSPRRMILNDVPEWLRVGLLELSDPVERVAAWGFSDLPDLNDPVQKAQYEAFRERDLRWDWESWLSFWSEEQWDFEVDTTKSVLQLSVDEFPNGLIGPMDHLIQLAGVKNEIVPVLEFSR